MDSDEDVGTDEFADAAISEETLDWIRTESRKLAVGEALRVTLSDYSLPDGSIPQTFGKRWAIAYGRIRFSILESYGEHFDGLILLAVRWFVYAKHRSAAFIRAYETGSVEPSAKDVAMGGEIVATLTTPDGVPDSAGWAYTLWDALSDVDQPSELLADLPFSSHPPAEHILSAISLIWFDEASRIYEVDRSCALGWLLESANADKLANVTFNWDAAVQWANEEAQSGERDPVRTLARKAAAASHARHNQIAAEVATWYEKSHASFRSLDAAAAAATEKFPLSFRTARKHIGIASKKLRSASKT